MIDDQLPTSILPEAKASSIHQFSARSIEGKEIDFKYFKGKKLLIVNTASECGLTPQFKQLEELHQQYKAELQYRPDSYKTSNLQ